MTNTLTALTEARKASTPMLLLAGDTAARILRHNQDVDQTAIFKSIGVTVARVRSADTLMIDLSRAFNQALAAQQPIAISIPSDMQGLECEADGLAAVTVQTSMPSRPPAEEIRRAVEATAASKRPAIIAGRGQCVPTPGKRRTFGRADRRIVGDHRPGQGFVRWESFLRRKLRRICLGTG